MVIINKEIVVRRYYNGGAPGNKYSIYAESGGA